jgi:hypothetical protein
MVWLVLRLMLVLEQKELLLEPLVVVELLVVE